MPGESWAGKEKAMSDDFLDRARMALQDMHGRVEAGKLMMFLRTIEHAEALEARAEKAEAELDAVRGAALAMDKSASDALTSIIAERDAMLKALSIIAVMGYSNDPAINDEIAKQAVGQARAALNREAGT